MSTLTNDKFTDGSIDQRIVEALGSSSPLPAHGRTFGLKIIGRQNFTLSQRTDAWGDWYELEEQSANDGFYLGFKMVDGRLYEITGDYIAYQSEYEASELPWTLVVAVDNDEVNALLRGQFGEGFGQFPVLDVDSDNGWNELIELKKQAGYRLSEDGEFEVVDNVNGNNEYGP